jgi:hypothetical protein
VDPWAVCPYMKMITPTKLLTCLQEGRDEVDVDPDIAGRARGAVERMIALGASSAPLSGGAGPGGGAPSGGGAGQTSPAHHENRPSGNRPREARPSPAPGGGA